MRFIKLFLRMLRYRSALVLVLFMLLGAAWHGDLDQFASQLTLAGVALLCTYACATSVNDLADLKIDQINLQGHSDRPLITGEASKSDLIKVACITAVIPLVIGVILKVTLIIAVILLINIFYSLPPFRISHKTVLTPFYLVVSYMVLPYLIGVMLVGSSLSRSDQIFLPALYCLFLARISLKDFRDREGDAQHNKPTFILKYGKKATCILSISSLCLGGLLLLISIHQMPWLVAGLALYLLALIMTELRLMHATDRLKELVSIGFGARIGNGMLFILLGEQILKSRSDMTPQVILYGSITMLYAFTFIEFWRKPESFQFGSQEITAREHELSQAQ